MPTFNYVLPSPKKAMHKDGTHFMFQYSIQEVVRTTSATFVTTLVEEFIIKSAHKI
jgi:hypothetical protein